MYRRTRVNVGMVGLSLAVLACGGSQPPAESPEQTPAASETAPVAPDAAEHPEAEHTMPDGTTMPGHQHGEGTNAPSPDEKAE